MSEIRITVGNPKGYTIAELTPQIERVSWRVNKVGKATFSMAISDSKVTSTNLNYGNRVYIDFDNGLPAWGGIIDVPRTWKNGLVICTAFSGMQLFKYRITGKTRIFDSFPAGVIYQSLVQEANDAEDMGIQIGSIWQGGGGKSQEYHYQNLLSIFQEHLTRKVSTGDFDVVPTLESGRIIFTANFHDNQGKVNTNVVLAEGENLADIQLTEQGPIVNDWLMAGAGQDWSDDRLTAQEIDDTSRADRGLRQDSRVVNDITTQGDLDAHAANYLSESKDPYNIFRLEAKNVDPAGFGAYALGDTVSLVAPSYGFGGTNTTVRILTREFDPIKDTCNLAVREVL